MSTTEVGAPARPAPRSGRTGIRGFADRWPFRRKLNILVGVPLGVVAAMLGYLITDQVNQALDADAAAQLVRDSAQVAELVDLVETEHQQAVLLSVRYESTGPGWRPSTKDYRTAQAAVDAQVDTVRETFGDRLPATEAQALKEINGLSSLRETVERAYLPADNIDPAYTNASQGLIDGLGLDHNATLAGTFTGNLLDSLLRADAAHSAFETAVFSARTGDSNALIEFIGAVGSENEYTHQADRFARFASEDQVNELGGIEHNSAQATIDRDYAELQIDPSNLQADTPQEIRRAFTAALDAYPDYRAQSENRLKITASLIDQIADRADRTSSEAAWRATLLLGLALLGFALWITFAVLVRRSVVRPVQALTGAARQVAEVAGRELARVADDDAEDDAPPRLHEVPVTAKDEIGDLAAAFNHVQTTASALLERQVHSRRNVAEMFGNVGRRVSNLTTRQLALIDAVERGETDPALLERLYSIDHIAVRLRRNADSLMLLAGIRETVLDSGPTELTNVVRAALGQIEGFRRVQLRAWTDVMVQPDIIGDLTLMVAELVENAVQFSPAGSPVEVMVKTGDGGALVVVTDHGLGMSAERLAEENARLIRRERLDVVPTKVLGLFVVGTLARRWEIGVNLSRTPGGGLTAEVIIPSALLLTMSPVAVAAGGATAESAGRTSGGAPSGAGSATGAEGAAVGSASRAAIGSGADTAPGSGSGSASTGSTGAAAAPDDDGAAPPLPRRVPQRGTGTDTAADTTADSPGVATADTGQDAVVHSADAPFIPRARDGVAEAAPDSGDGSRPLRRRVRGATLRTTFGADPDQPAVRRAAPRPADAEAVRASLDEFEAAVERAHRDTETGSHRRPAFRDDETRTDPDHTPRADEAAVAPRVPQTASNPPHHQNHSPEGAEQ
ncbi:ATP-binding protein [Streptomyces sp. YU58]|uniref:sensor histidine kinase n=1 Tax=Streptomyces sp. SX92 TaxID=3158972 RepID=UPI0027BA3E3B|nr:ATP-binding protein [Streptomyces coralus]WLW51456.1 HAMP domain-containing protein [Streptomyces coralus]